MNNLVDDILQDLDSAISEHISNTNSSNSSSHSAFTDEDISNILEDNGFPSLTPAEAEGIIVEAVEHTANTFSPFQASEGNIDNFSNAEPSNVSTSSSEESEVTNTVDNASNSSQNEKTLPLNSPTLLMDDSTARFSGAEWYNEIQKARIIVAGIGGIGSNTVFQLARMAPNNITLYDDDIVERVNMAGQLYCHDDVGKSKVDAIADMIYSYTSIPQVTAVKGLFGKDTEPGDIMICGFDNMNARKLFFNSWSKHVAEKKEEDKAKCLYIDGRLSMDTLQILCIKGDDTYNRNRYRREFLFSDYEADHTVCSMKQTTYLACMIGSLITNLFINFIANSLNPAIPYDLPFFTEYDAQNMIFKTEN